MHLISPLGFKTNGSRCVTHIVSQLQLEDPGRTIHPALITVDHLGPDPSHRTYLPYPCPRIDQAASAQTLPRLPSSLPLPPTLHTSRCHVHRNLNKEPLASIGLRVGIERISMTTMTVAALQDVIECEAFSPRSILLVPRKIACYQNLRSSQHPRPFILLLCILFPYLLLFVP